jgi:hypothetical protein
MTLADLCSLLIERESVIHRLPTPLPKRKPKKVYAGKRVPSNEIAVAAEELGVFTRAQLEALSGCSFHAARHWLARNKVRLVEQSHKVQGNGGTKVVWRWKDSNEVQS